MSSIFVFPFTESADVLRPKAESGDEESRLSLGRLYLKLADSDIDREENASKAVHWLIESSKQGSEEATEQLTKCQKTKTGIYLIKYVYCYYNLL
jgi:TPR repeat protein